MNISISRILLAAKLAPRFQTTCSCLRNQKNWCSIQSNMTSRPKQVRVEMERPINTWFDHKETKGHPETNLGLMG